MTTAAQLRLTGNGRKVWATDLTAITSEPATMTLGAFPPNAIDVRHSKGIALMPYGIQSVDASVATMDFFGIMELGRQGAADVMYSTHLLITGVAIVLEDAVPGLAGGLVDETYSFADSLTNGTITAGTVGDALIDMAGQESIPTSFAVGSALSDRPCLYFLSNLGPLVGIVPRLTTLGANISAFNLLRFPFSAY